MLRAGYSHNDNPIRAEDVTFNILAPGVIEDHVTLGFTYKTKSGGELTMFYMHAFENSVTGSSLFNSFGVARRERDHQDVPELDRHRLRLEDVAPYTQI